MSEAKKRYAVLTMQEYPDREDETKKRTRWLKVGVGYLNHDGSINLYLNAFPIGTNKLQIREDDGIPLVPGTRRPGIETIEVRP